MRHLSRLPSLALAIAIVIGAPLAQAAEKTAPPPPAAVTPAKTKASATPPLT
ncbi:peptidase S41, partial [Pseudomonas syringae pv. tagetis]